jgi:hypothetical protein
MITCSYTIQGEEGATKGMSFAQIMNNAIAVYLSKKTGYPIGSQKFKIERAKDNLGYVEIILDPISLKRMRELYSLVRQDCASPQERKELQEYQDFFNARQQYALKHNRKSP